MDDMEDLLDYEKEMFLNLHHDNGLLVCSRGLGIDRIFYYFVKLYSDPQCLVLVINSYPDEAQSIIDDLKNESNVGITPKLLSAETSINDRLMMYRDGGVLFVSSRILVVDLLSERVPVPLITGIMLVRAHQTLETCQEAFILRLYREKNSTGFVKAFTEQPSSLIAGFNHVQRLMISCQARNLHLWPRFHASVVSNLKDKQPIVQEVRIPLTDDMIACQRALLDLLNACLKELGRINSMLDLDELTVENALTRSFDNLIKRSLDPHWHRLNGQSRQLVSDVNTLRRLTRHLTLYDPITFYSVVESLRTSAKVFGQNAGWLFFDEAGALFSRAKNRVFKMKSDKGGNPERIFCVEEFPKWTALREILDEIEKAEGSLDSTLIVVDDERTAKMVRNFVENGSEHVINELKARYLKDKVQFLEEVGAKQTATKRPKVEPGQPTLTQMMTDKSEEVEEATLESSNGLKFYHVHKTTASHRPRKDRLPSILAASRPKNVVLYNVDMTTVRQVEVFQACCLDVRITVFLLVFNDSVEEQRYLTTLRQEKESFEYLISEKSSLVLPEDLLNAWDGVEEQSVTINTRKAGGSLTTSRDPPRVVVDMREFRSSLPSLVHRIGIKIVPQTIDIGDYILSPDICVERKSINDLIGSLNSGRLYNQCIAMTRTYKKPMLLIEFDSKKAFSLYSGGHRQAMMSADFNSSDVMSKLVLLTQNFPTLRILWSPSPYATAEMFSELKQGLPEPLVLEGVSDPTDQMVAEALEKPKWLNCRTQDMLVKLPGVTDKNYRHLLKHANCLLDLCNLSKDEINLMFENEMQAKTLYNFLHADKGKEIKEIEKANANTKRDARGGYRRYRMNLKKKP